MCRELKEHAVPASADAAPRDLASRTRTAVPRATVKTACQKLYPVRKTMFLELARRARSSTCSATRRCEWLQLTRTITPIVLRDSKAKAMLHAIDICSGTAHTSASLMDGAVWKTDHAHIMIRSDVSRWDTSEHRTGVSRRVRLMSARSHRYRARTHLWCAWDRPATLRRGAVWIVGTHFRSNPLY